MQKQSKSRKVAVLKKKAAVKKTAAKKVEPVKGVYNPKTKQVTFIKGVKRRMILDKRWSDQDLKALAGSHNMKPKKYVEEMILNNIVAFRDLKLNLFFNPPVKKKK